MLSKIKGLLQYKNYHLFTRPYELNIVGLRGKSTIPNRFDDELHVFYKTGAFDWDYHVFKITTDPGTYWLNNPMNPQGTAILKEGQYLNSHMLGLHKGQYTALVQAKPVTVVRDYDRDAVLDFYNGRTETGQFGINVHRANRVGETVTIDRNSAGCQVFANASDFERFIQLCREHERRYGNHFTYSLIDFRTVQRRRRKNVLVAASAIAAIGFAGHYYYSKKQKQYVYA